MTANYFAALGLAAGRGRLFVPSQADEREDIDPVVIISHALWRQRYGAASDAVGRTITVNGIPATIVGVAPPGFRGVEKDTRADLWMPLSLFLQMDPVFSDILKRQRGAHWLTVVGYLSEGASLEDARAELALLSQQHAEAYPDTNEDFRLRVVDAGRGVIWPDRRAGVTTLSGTLSAGVVLVMLIACANVGNLLLVRAAGRRREFAVRLALGASRGHLARLLLTESAILAFASGAAGLVLAAWARGALARTLVPPDLAHLLEGGLGGGVVTLTVALALFAGLAFGLAPALRASNPDIVAAIKSDLGHGGYRRGRLTLGNGLVVAQIALSLPLLVNATLISRSLWNQMTIDLGVETNDLLLVDIDPGSGGYEPDEGQAIYDQLLERVRSMPGVTAAAYTRVAPLGRTRLAGEVATAGMANEDARRSVEVNIVSPGYAATSGAALLRGREFVAADSGTGNSAVMVNHTMAELFWPGSEPLGQFIEMNWLSGPIRAPVVGIIADHRYARVRNEQISVADERPRLYLPLGYDYQSAMTLMVRSSADARSLAGPILQITRELAPAVPDTRVESFRQHVARLLPQQRLVAGLLIVAGVIGLALAAVGIYAVMAYSVSRRVHEMGVRRTLGAQRSDVLWQILGEGLTLCSAGIVVGLLGALGAGRLIAGMLYGVESTDPVSYLGVAATLGIVAALATWLPGRAAADCDPLRALRRQ